MIITKGRSKNTVKVNGFTLTFQSVRGMYRGDTLYEVVFFGSGGSVAKLEGQQAQEFLDSWEESDENNM